MTESEPLRQLKYHDWLVRKATVEHSKATKPVLLKALKDKNPDVRLAAVNNPDATEPIFKRAALDKDERVCKAVAFGHVYGRGVVSQAVAGLEEVLAAAAATV